jgi:flagellar hook-basal body complex protein FliE
VSLAGIGAVLGSAAQISPVGGLGGAANLTATQSSSPDGFGGALTQAISSLQQTQDTASTQAAALATGQTTDESTVVADVEGAQLAMELASQIMSKSVASVQQIFQTQV